MDARSLSRLSSEELQAQLQAWNVTIFNGWVTWPGDLAGI